MYNGIGLTTPRGSGTNGHVQRNFAFVRPGKKDNIHYRTEEDIAKLEASTNRQPNLEILDHERKRKIEVKCAELEEALESQGFSEEEIQAKVDAYRNQLMGTAQNGNDNAAKDSHGRPILKETHEIAQAQQQKNARLREAFGISEYFVEGTSFDGDRKAREELAKSDAIQKEIQADKVEQKKYTLVRTPSPSSELKATESEDDNDKEKKKAEKKKKKKRELSPSPDRKKDSKKKKSKKHKKDSSKKKRSKKHHSSDDSSESSDSESSSSSSSESSTSSDESSDDRHKKRKKSKKNKKKKSKKQKQARERSRERDRSLSQKRKENDKSNKDKEMERSDRKRDEKDTGVKSVDQSQNAKRKRSPSPAKRPAEKRVSRTPERKRDDSKREPAARSRQRSPLPLRKRSPSPRNNNNRYERSPKRNFSRDDKFSRRKRTPSPPPPRRNRSRSYDPRDSRRMRSRSRESRYDRRDVKERRIPTPKRRSIERKRTPEKNRTPPVRKRSLTPKKRSLTPKKRSTERKSDYRRHERVTDDRSQQKYPDRKRQANKSKSPVQRKAPRFDNQTNNNNNNNNGKKVEKERSLSYSPARRNPDRYKEILESKSKLNEKARKHTGPVVKLHPTESDNESPDNNKEETSKEDDYFIDKNQDKELNRLKALKSELTAKAKESLEKKLISESNTGGAPRKVDTNPVIQQVAAARNNEKEVAKALSIAKAQQPAVEKSASENKSTRGRKSRSISSKRSHHSGSSSGSSRSSRSRSHTHSSSDGSHRSSSNSSHSSHSSRSSSSRSSRSRTPPPRHVVVAARSSRSPSIPRRAGSPSFLDRRRITRSRSHSRSYYRRTRR